MNVTIDSDGAPVVRIFLCAFASHTHYTGTVSGAHSTPVSGGPNDFNWHIELADLKGLGSLR